MTSLDHLRQGRKLVENEGRRLSGQDPLPRLLAQLIERAGEPASIESAVSRPWASALFQGRQHVITLRIKGPDARDRRARFVEGLEEVEWTLLRDFVADIIIDGGRSDADDEWVELSALTIEDW